MFYRTLIFAFLAVGALAMKLQLSVQGRKSIKTTLTGICTQAGGGAEQNADHATNALQSFFDCIHPLIDDDTVNEEIQAAEENGTVNEVAKKYCAKTPEFKTCLHKLTDGFGPCVKNGEKDQLNLIKNVTDQFIDYVCYKDGVRITQFVTENGTKCIQSKSAEINTCFSTFQSQLDAIENAQALPLAEKCGLLDQLSTCSLKTLETCSTPTPGNILQSLFIYVREGTACNDVLPKPK